VSGAGRRDGLYFPVKAGEPGSPLGPLFDRMPAGKGEPGSAPPTTATTIASSKGRAGCAGGTYSYLAQGRMIGGFALVAWPAAYGKTGIMTFV